MHDRFAVAFGLFFGALLFRAIDIFVLRLDEIWGEILLSKSIGLALVLIYIRASGRSMVDLGLRRKFLGRTMLVTVLAVVPVYAVAYGLQYVVFVKGGKSPYFALEAIDPKTGMSGGVVFALWLLLGNLVNSTMEEGLFRGVMLPSFASKVGYLWANLFQAGLFALWHVVWPIKDLVSGRLSIGEAAGQAVMIMAATAISGYVFGSLYVQTGSLWSPWVAHTINNSVFNLVHIRTIESVSPDIFILHAVVVLGIMGVVPLVRAYHRVLGFTAESSDQALVADVGEGVGAQSKGWFQRD